MQVLVFVMLKTLLIDFRKMLRREFGIQNLGPNLKLIYALNWSNKLHLGTEFHCSWTKSFRVKFWDSTISTLLFCITRTWKENCPTAVLVFGLIAFVILLWSLFLFLLLLSWYFYFLFCFAFRNLCSLLTAFLIQQMSRKRKKEEDHIHENEHTSKFSHLEGMEFYFRDWNPFGSFFSHFHFCFFIFPFLSITLLSPWSFNEAHIYFREFSDSYHTRGDRNA